MQTFACSGKLGEEAAVLSEITGDISDEEGKFREDFRNSETRFFFSFLFFLLSPHRLVYLLFVSKSLCTTLRSS